MKKLYTWKIKTDILEHPIVLYIADSTESISVEKKVRPVLYMFDGQNLMKDSQATYGRSWRIPQLLDESYLEDDVLIVGISSSEDPLTRIKEYSPYLILQGSPYVEKINDVPINGQGDKMIRYIIEELMPFIELNFNMIHIPSQTAIGGSSMGALLSMYAILHYSDYFQRCMAFSGAYFYNNESLIEDIIGLNARDLRNIKRIYMDVGLKEVSDSHPNNTDFYKIFNDRVFDHLVEKLPNEKIYYFTDENGEHNEASWESRFFSAFRYIFDL